MNINSNDEEELLLSDPRDHHYLFAHRVTYKICQDDPVQFFSLMASSQQRDFIQYFWDTVKQLLSGTEADFDVEQTEVSTGRIKNYPCIIIKMPEPRAIAEAYMIGIVLKVDDESALEDPNITFDYFTLELGQNMDGSLRTVLCQWKDGKHMNMGTSLVPELSNFISEIEKRV